MLYHILHALLILSCVACVLSGVSMRYDLLRMRDVALRKGRSGEDYCGKLLDRHGGIDRIENIALGDARDDDTTEIDFIINCQTHLTIVESKAWSGLIVGGSAYSEVWSIQSPYGVTTFRKNPILQVARHADFLSRVHGIPRSKCQIAVVMTGNVVFSDSFDMTSLDGILFTTSTIHGIRNILSPWRGVSEVWSINSFWDALVYYAYSSEQERWQQEHARKIRKREISIPAWVCTLAFAFLILIIGGIFVEDISPMQ